MSKKQLDKKELIQKFRREGILEAARSVIALHGLDKTTMEQVAEEAGISKATIYIYFKNKEDLYEQCVIEGFDRLLGAVKAAAEGVEDPAERIERILESHLSSVDNEMDFFRIVLTERMSIFIDRDRGLAEEFGKRHAEFVNLVAEAVRDGVKSGAFRDVDPVKGFYFFFAMIRAMVMYRIVNLDPSPISSDSGLMLDMFFNGIKGKSPAGAGN